MTITNRIENAVSLIEMQAGFRTGLHDAISSQIPY